MNSVQSCASAAERGKVDWTNEVKVFINLVHTTPSTYTRFFQVEKRYRCWWNMYTMID